MESAKKLKIISAVICWSIVGVLLRLTVKGYHQCGLFEGSARYGKTKFGDALLLVQVTACGMSFALILHYFLLLWSPAYKLGQPTEAPVFNPLVFAVPSCLDMLNMVCESMATLLAGPAVVVMVSGFTVPMTIALSSILLRKNIYTVPDLSASAFICVGTIMIGISASSDVSGTGQFIGSMIAIVATVFGALESVTTERLLKQLNLPLLQAVGLAGLIQFLIISALQVILVCCPQDPDVEYPWSSVDRQEHVSIFDHTLQQLQHTPQLYWLLILVIVLGLSFNYCNFMLVSLVDSAFSMIVRCCRGFLLWIVASQITWGNADGQAWEPFKADDWQTWLKCFGYVMNVCGLLVYMEIGIPDTWRREKSDEDKAEEQDDKTIAQPGAIGMPIPEESSAENADDQDVAQEGKREAAVEQPKHIGSKKTNLSTPYTTPYTPYTPSALSNMSSRIWTGISRPDHKRKPTLTSEIGFNLASATR